MAPQRNAEKVRSGLGESAVLRGRRASSGQRRTRTDDEQLGTELLGVCVAALQCYGVQGARILKTDPSKILAAKRPRLAARLLHDTFSLGKVVEDWSENPRYIDESGRPRVLPLRGRGSTFSALVAKHFGRRDTQRVLELALRTRVVERVGPDKVAQINACVMLTGHPTLLLARAVLSIRGFLEVIRRNSATNAKRSALSPERMATAYVRREDFEEFAALMRPQLSNLTDQGNRWLTAHMVRDRPRASDRDVAFTGVHAYVFQE